MQRPGPDFSFEHEAIRRGFAQVAGIDEAGRGPLAGPVVAAAVILDPERLPAGLNDSKTLTPNRRECLMGILAETASVSVGLATVAEIDALNILEASHLAMCRALERLHRADFALVDGNLVPRALGCPAEPIVKGDARSLSVAAASIVAKCTRDRIMVDLAQQYPGYGWERNMGYPTKTHLDALRNLGPTPYHRRSFAPVHKILCQEKSVSD